MTDPISIFSAIATSISLLKIAMQTAKEIRTTYDELREAEDRFNEQCLYLTTCQTSMEYWNRSWNIARRTQYSGVIVWGLDGARVIDRYLQGIKKLTEVTRDILQLHTSPANPLLPENAISSIEDRRAWYHATNANDRRGAVDGLPAALKKRCLLVLFRSSKLSEKINRLQGLIERLTKESCLRWALQHTGDRCKPTQEEISRVLKLNRIRDFMIEWYKICVAEDTEDWALELRLPSNPEFNIWEFVEEATINFTIIDRKVGVEPQRRNFTRVQISLLKGKESNEQPLPLSETTLYEFFRNYEAWQAQGTLISHADSIFKMKWIEPPTRNMIERYRWTLKERLRKVDLNDSDSLSFSLERTSLAYGTAIWILMLLSTPWLSQLCSCGLHSLIISENNLCNIHLPMEECSCGIYQVTEDRMLLYGILLCELAMGKPVFITPADGSNHFVIEGKALTEEQLLEKLRERKESSRYEEAVRFCLDFVPNSQENSPDVEAINAFKKRVLEPIQVLHNINDKKKERRQKREKQLTLLPS